MAINKMPVFTADPVTTLEDTEKTFILNVDDSDPMPGENQVLTFTLTSFPTHGAITAFDIHTGQVTYMPDPDYNGPDSFKVRVSDDEQAGPPPGLLTDEVTVTITVNPVNNEPSFTAVNPPAVNEDAGARSIVGWATFDPGPDNESGQTVLQYIISDVSNPALFAAGPAVANDGTLTYTPATDAFGTSTFKVAVRDTGGTDNGGDDTSPTQTFTITVNAVNNEPSFTAVNPRR